MAASSVSEIVSEGFEFSESNNVFMSLMEEIQEDDYDQCNGDDHRLLSIIQSLEAEISSRSDPLGQVDGQDFSTSSVRDHDDYNWMNMEAASSSSSSPFDEMMMDAWSPCAAVGDDSDYSQYYYGVLLEQQFRESYLPQEPSDAVF